MFHHVKELPFNARVSGPDPRFARMLLDQFGGPNGELKAAMQYFVQAFGCRRPYPRIYDMMMDIATEEFSHFGNCRGNHNNASRWRQWRTQKRGGTVWPDAHAQRQERA